MLNLSKNINIGIAGIFLICFIIFQMAIYKSIALNQYIILYKFMYVFMSFLSVSGIYYSYKLYKLRSIFYLVLIGNVVGIWISIYLYIEVLSKLDFMVNYLKYTQVFIMKPYIAVVIVFLVTALILKKVTLKSENGLGEDERCL